MHLSVWQFTETGVFSCYLWLSVFVSEISTCHFLLKCARVHKRARMCTFGLMTHTLMTVCVGPHVYTHICVHDACIHACKKLMYPDGNWAMLKSAATHFYTRPHFQFSNAVSTMETCHCSFLLYSLKFVVLSVVVSDPFHQLGRAYVCFSERQSKGSQKLLLWQPPELVNCQLKDCSRTS